MLPQEHSLPLYLVDLEVTLVQPPEASSWSNKRHYGFRSLLHSLMPIHTGANVLEFSCDKDLEKFFLEGESHSSIQMQALTYNPEKLFGEKIEFTRGNCVCVISFANQTSMPSFKPPTTEDMSVKNWGKWREDVNRKTQDIADQDLDKLTSQIPINLLRNTQIDNSEQGVVEDTKTHQFNLQTKSTEAKAPIQYDFSTPQGGQFKAKSRFSLSSQKKFLNFEDDEIFSSDAKEMRLSSSKEDTSNIERPFLTKGRLFDSANRNASLSSGKKLIGSGSHKKETGVNSSKKEK